MAIGRASVSDSIESRVALGAALLDERRPGWFREVDRDSLEMGSCRRCVLGQLYGLYSAGRDALRHGTPPGEMSLAAMIPGFLAAARFSAAHGFNFNGFAPDYDFDALRSAWLSEIGRRRPISPLPSSVAAALRTPALDPSPAPAVVA
jgi:hypothetical protein